MNLEGSQIGRSWTVGGKARRWNGKPSVLRLRLAFSLLVIDLLVILASFWLADIMRGSGASNAQWMLTCVVLVPVYVIMAFNAQAYAGDVLVGRTIAISRAVRSLGMAFGILALAVFWLKASAQFSRLTLAIAGVNAVLLLTAARYLFVGQAKALIGGNPYSVVLIHDHDQPIPPGNYSIVIMADGQFDPDEQGPDMYERLARTLKPADRVVVACREERRASWASALKGVNVQSEVLIPELEPLAPLGFTSHDGAPAVIVAKGPPELKDRIVKRLFDLAIAGPAIVALAPLFALIAVLIRLESPGPVFFVQPRIGRGSTQFRIFKFRSMRHDLGDSAGHRSTSRDDDRITRFGGFLRKTSLDELPQILNVLLGDMSLVGPRPHAIGSRAANKLFWEIDERYWHRHAAKPGLTGLAQVRGYRGATIEESDLLNRLQADLEYLANWSIWKDVRIILMTFRVLLHRNAY